jgi:hypothetical protein
LDVASPCFITVPMTAAIAIIASKGDGETHGRNQLNDFGDEGTTGFQLDAGGAGATHADQIRGQAAAYQQKGQPAHAAALSFSRCTRTYFKPAT